jgi:hypothetical protein
MDKELLILNLVLLCCSASKQTTKYTPGTIKRNGGFNGVDGNHWCRQYLIYSLSLGAAEGHITVSFDSPTSAAQLLNNFHFINLA